MGIPVQRESAEEGLRLLKHTCTCKRTFLLLLYLCKCEWERKHGSVISSQPGWASYTLKSQSGRTELCSDKQSEGLWQFIKFCHSQKQSTAAEPGSYTFVAWWKHPFLAPHCNSPTYFFLLPSSEQEGDFLCYKWPCVCCCLGYQVMAGKV